LTRFRRVATIAAVFVAVGPAVGAIAIALQRPPASVRVVVLLSYVFGAAPALIAGILYGALSVRGHGVPSRWYTRALLGAGAGLCGCLLFFLFVSAYDLLTIPERTVADLEIPFLRRLLLAGIPAGIVCALLAGSIPARPKAS
jgi:hypothetical protein